MTRVRPGVVPSPAPGPRTGVSVVVPTFERADELEATLRSLEAQRGAAGPGLQVVVVDDGSHADLLPVIRRHERTLDLLLVRQPDRGFRAAAARNLGARVATGDVLVFLDCGTLAGQDLVEAHRRAHERAGGAVVATFAPTYGYDVTGPDKRRLRDVLLSAPGAIDLAPLAGVPGMDDYRTQKLLDVQLDGTRLAVPWRFFWSRNVSVHADAFAAVGGFDDSYDSYGVEDIELGYRLYRHGVPLVWVPEAWGAEVPTFEGEEEALGRSNRTNLLALADRYADVEVEFYVVNRPLERLEQQEFDLIDRWRGEAGTTPADRDVVARAAAAGSVLVVGADDRVPDLPGVVRVGPSFASAEGAWARALATGRGDVSGLGIRLGLPSDSFDVVVLTSALAGIWSRWGEWILAEARRVGRAVELGAGVEPALTRTSS